MTNDNALDSEIAELLAELEARENEPKPATLPKRLPVAAITLERRLFQHRAIDERHIQELRRSIKTSKQLDALLVFQVGADALLIDGHHRKTAYEQSKVTKPVPVRYFEGTAREAVLEALKANSKAKKEMTFQEKQNAAWRFVLSGVFSKKEISEAAVVSVAQVAIMRKVATALGDEAGDYRSWWHARKAANGKAMEKMTAEEEEAMLEALVTRYAERLSKEFGNKLTKHPSLTARVLNHHLGRQLPEVWAEMKAYLPEDDGTAGEDEDF